MAIALWTVGGTTVGGTTVVISYQLPIPNYQFPITNSQFPMPQAAGPRPHPSASLRPIPQLKTQNYSPILPSPPISS
ncbi:MAG: hypothetical protein WCD53_17865 [Microcoleus sp.]